MSGRAIAVLVVEDELLVAMDIEQILEEAGAKVTAVVASAEEALSACARDLPDVALIDVKIRGEMDGIELGEALRAQGVGSCIFVTAAMEPDVEERLRGFGPEAVIYKPFSRRDLLDRLPRMAGEVGPGVITASGEN